MTKKVLVFVMSLFMVLTAAAPAFAAEKVSDDADVQAAYDAYIEMTDAMYVAGDYAAMNTALDDLDKASGDIDEDTAKSDEWEKLVGDKIGSEKFVNDAFNAAFIMQVFEKEMDGEAGLIEAYKAAPDIKKAYDLVDTYQILEEDKVLMDKMAEGIDALDPSRQAADTYKAAETAISAVSPDVIAVYEAYIYVSSAVSGPWTEDFDEAISEFEKVLDTFNEGLDDSEKADLAVLVGAKDWEEAFGMILDDWVNINIADEMIDIYDAYKADPNKETAKAFVEKYDSVYNDPEYVDEDLREFVAACVEDIEGVYAEALDLLDGDAADGTEAEIVDSPDTGDNMKILPFILIMVAAAAVAVAVLFRKRK